MKKVKEQIKYVTQKQLEKHKKEIIKLINNAKKEIKKWDIKQDKILEKTSVKKIKSK